jgi:glutamine synthetase
MTEFINDFTTDKTNADTELLHTLENILIEKIFIEYVWIDFDGNLRSKLRVENADFVSKPIEEISWWNFDGSSTKQSEGKFSDVLLKPVRLYANPFFGKNTAYFLLCECYTPDKTPHETNTRYKCVETFNKYKHLEPLFGIEQEYMVIDHDKNSLANHVLDKGNAEGRSYCAVGGDRSFFRNLSTHHLQYCMKAGIEICGTNAEVTPLQWEWQIGVCDPVKVSDDLMMSRYIMQRLSESYNCSVTFHPKPLREVNGSGAHTNFSIKQTRNPIDNNGLEEIRKICESLKQHHQSHMKVYGSDNNLRMTGIHETSSYDNFSYGEGNRGCSIRIPLQVVEQGYGYFEDRRPASNCDPYLVTEVLTKNVCKLYE